MINSPGVLVFKKESQISGSSSDWVNQNVQRRGLAISIFNKHSRGFVSSSKFGKTLS